MEETLACVAKGVVIDWDGANIVWPTSHVSLEPRVVPRRFLLFRASCAKGTTQTLVVGLATHTTSTAQTQNGVALEAR